MAYCGDGYFSALVISCKEHFERTKLPEEKKAVLKKTNTKRNHVRMGRQRGNISKKTLLQGLYVHSSHVPQLGMCLSLR